MQDVKEIPETIEKLFQEKINGRSTEIWAIVDDWLVVALPFEGSEKVILGKIVKEREVLE